MTADPRAAAYPGGPTNVEIELVADLLRQGRTVELVTRGSSMWPAMRAGERLWIAPPEGLAVGDLAAVRRPSGFVVHRVVAMDPGVVRLRGDHADTEERVAPGDVCGMVVRHRTRSGLEIDYRSRWVRLAGRVVAGVTRRTTGPWRLAYALRHRMISAR